MKQLLAAIVIAPFICSAQDRSESAKMYLNRIKYAKSDDTDTYRLPKEIKPKQLVAHGIKEIRIEYGIKKKRRRSLSVTAHGMVSKTTSENDTVCYTYENDSLISTVEGSGKRKYHISYSYESGNLVRKETGKKGKITSRLLIQYDGKNNVVFSVLQNGRSLGNSFVMRYTYEEEQLRMQEFFRNNKRLKKWDYTCSEKGEDVTEKDEITMCTYTEERADGSYTKFVRSMEKGKIRLNEYDYAADSTLLGVKCMREDESLISVSTFTKTERKTCFYDKNGAHKSTHTYIYNDNGQLLRREAVYGKKQKRTTLSVNEYRADGMLAKSMYKYKGKWVSQSVYEYIR